MTARVKVDKAMLIKALQDRLVLGEKANAIQEKNNAKIRKFISINSINNLC